jgi:hypothetical protein
MVDQALLVGAATGQTFKMLATHYMWATAAAIKLERATKAALIPNEDLNRRYRRRAFSVKLICP